MQYIRQTWPQWVIEEYPHKHLENPDQFLERLEQLERHRIEERSTLRHKNSTKWSKEKRLLAKFNNQVIKSIKMF